MNMLTRQLPPADFVEQMRTDLAGMPYRWDPQVPAGPVVLPAALGSELAGALTSLMRLLHRAVHVIDDEPVARNTALAMAKDFEPLYMSREFEHAYANLIARPDVILTNEGWKFIEFNVSAAVGGQSYVYLLNDLWRKTVAEASTPQLHLADPLRPRGQVMRGIAEALGVKPKIAVLGCARDIDLTDLRYYDVEVAELNRSGCEAEYFEAEAYLDYLAAGGEKFPLGLQEMDVQDWVDHGRSLDQIAAIRRSGTTLLASQTSYQVGDKRMVAALSSGQEWMTSDDVELVSRYIPWTREIRDSQVSYKGSTWHLPRLLSERRADFVIKPHDRSCAIDVSIGKVTDDATWSQVVQRALDEGTWVVQEYQPSLPIPVEIVDTRTSDYRRIEVPAVFGPFLVGDAMAGCWVRFDSQHDGGVIILSRRSVHMSTVAWNR